MQDTKMSFEEWQDKYKPITNFMRTKEDTDLFETYGDELAFVRGVNLFNPNRVWTLIEGDRGLWVTNGYHYVNRLNYFITEEPYEGADEFVDVLYMEFDDEEDNDDHA